MRHDVLTSCKQSEPIIWEVLRPIAIMKLCWPTKQNRGHMVCIKQEQMTYKLQTQSQEYCVHMSASMHA